MSFPEIEWDKYPNLSCKCPNCGNEEDLVYALDIAFENFDEEDFKKFVIDKDCFGIDQYCDTCYHTYWFQNEAKEDLDKLVKEILDTNKLKSEETK